MSKPTYEELEAQCAEMRKVLEEVVTDLKRHYIPHKGWPEHIQLADQVLSTSTGKSLLERIAKLEAVAEAAKEAKNVIKMLHPIMDEDEPCIVYEVYAELTKTLAELEEEEKDV